MENAIEINALALKTKLKTKPIWLQGVMQRSLLEVTWPHDAIVGGNQVRLPSGVVLSLTACGANNLTGDGGRVLQGALMGTLRVRCLDGRVRNLPCGTQVQIIVP